MNINTSTHNDSQIVGRSTNKEVIALLTERLIDNLNLYYPDLNRDSTYITGKSLGGKYAQTFKFYLTSGGFKREIFAKICPIFESLDPAKMEYETLKLLYNKIQEVDRDLAVAYPIDYFPDLNAYAMESVGTRNFRDYLRKSNSRLRGDESISELLDYVSGSARWLSTFHRLTMSRNSVKFDSESFIKSIVTEFDYHILRNFRFPKNTLERLDKLISSLSSLNNIIDMPCAKWHWDYTPGHIFIDDGRISVIDILGLDDIPIYEDIGHFLAAMTSINNLPFYPFYDFERAYGMLGNRFIEAYSSDLISDQKIFILLSNIYRLKYLLWYFDGQYKSVCQKIHPIAGSTFANMRLIRIFNDPIRHTIDEIENGMRNLQ